MWIWLSVAFEISISEAPAKEIAHEEYGAKLENWKI